MNISENLCYNCFKEKSSKDGPCPFCGYETPKEHTNYIALAPGSILNGLYVVGRVLGQGGFGITYLALDSQLRVKVAIKEFMPEGLANRSADTSQITIYSGEKHEQFVYGQERFLDEARTLAKFTGNRNIAAVRSFFTENNTAYFVMEYIEGISFKSYIANKGGKVDYKDALRVITAVCDALETVHGEGFIHRDITPDNIYITKDNEVKLLDFGSAKFSLGTKSKSLDVILKPGYAPREQYLRRGRQGPYTDIYSLAATFYSAITGYIPPESLERAEEDSIVDISVYGVRIPDYIDDAIMKGLEVRAEDRFQTAREFKAALLKNDAPAPASETPAPQAALQAPAAVADTAVTSGVQAGSNEAPQTVNQPAIAPSLPADTSASQSSSKNTILIGICAGIAAACIVGVILVMLQSRSSTPAPAGGAAIAGDMDIGEDAQEEEAEVEEPPIEEAPPPEPEKPVDPYEQYGAITYETPYTTGELFYVSPENDTNIRRNPQLSSESAAIARTGEELVYLGNAAQEIAEDIIWYNVRHNPSGQSGWVSKKYIYTGSEYALAFSDYKRGVDEYAEGIDYNFSYAELPYTMSFTEEDIDRTMYYGPSWQVVYTGDITQGASSVYLFNNKDFCYMSVSRMEGDFEECYFRDGYLVLWIKNGQRFYNQIENSEFFEIEEARLKSAGFLKSRLVDKV